ncbi:MAG: hypothetical protein Fur005_33840 [Roseiflexaceae bacterium]
MLFTHGHALLIGIGTYANEPGINVPTCANDASSMWATLTDPQSCGYPDTQVQSLTDDQATKQGILDALDALAKADPEAMVVFFFSGHGVVLSDGTYALTTHDMRRSESGQIDPNSVIIEAELLTKLRNIRAKKLLCLINACHSGKVGPDTLDVDPNQPKTTLGAAPTPRLTGAILATGRGRVIMSACRPEQYAHVGDDELTVFPKALISTLQGEGVVSRRGYISVYDLYDRVYDLVTEAVDDQQPELTVIQGVGPFPVALFQGEPNATLSAFEAPNSPTQSKALRALSSTESSKLLQSAVTRQPVRSHTQTIGTNTGTAVAGDVHGNVTNIGSSTGPVIPGTVEGPVTIGPTIGSVSVGHDVNTATTMTVNNTDTGGGDNISIGGSVSNSSGIAIGRGSRVVYTGGGDYAEGSIDKRTISGDTYSGDFRGANLAIRSILTNTRQVIQQAPRGDARKKQELIDLIGKLEAALQQAQPAQQSQAEAVAETAKQAAEQASKATPNRSLVQISVEGLKQAASNLAATLPSILPIAQKIAEAITNFAA